MLVLSIIVVVSSIINDAVMLQIGTEHTRRIVTKFVWRAGYIFQRIWNNDRTGRSINEAGLDTSRVDRGSEGYGFPAGSGSVGQLSSWERVAYHF